MVNRYLVAYSKRSELFTGEARMSESAFEKLVPSRTLGCVELTPQEARDTASILRCDVDTDLNDYFVETYSEAW